jgi:hypothetical protein
VVASSDHLTGLTQARLKELLHYDPETGVFTWLVWRPNGVKVGDEAGAIHKAGGGYLKIKIDSRSYLASRLAWLYMTGKLPTFRVDHQDTDKLNNRWSNLRPATASQNSANRPAPRNNTSGRKGVHFHKARARWQAQIRVEGKLIHLGRFDSLDLAAAAYQSAAAKHFGQYARSA